MHRRLRALLPSAAIAVVFAGAPHRPVADNVIAVAVAEFGTSGADSLAWVGRTFSTSMITSLLRSRSYQVVEREYLEKIVGELELQASGLVDPASAVELGRLLGADVLVVGSVDVDGQRVGASARIVQVSTSSVLGTAEASGPLHSMLDVQRSLGLEMARVMAPLAPVLAGTLNEGEMPLDVVEELEDLDRLARGMPLHMKDPMRNRRTADLTLGLRIADDLVERFPALDVAHFHRALFALNADVDEAADESSAAALALVPGDPRYALLRATVLADTRRTDEAIAVLEALTQVHPGFSAGWYALSRQLVRSNALPRAIHALLRAAEGDRYIRDVETNLRTHLGSASAVDLIARLDQIEPGMSAAAELYRRAFNDRASLDMRTALRAVEARPGLYLGHLWVGTLRQTMRDPDGAERALREALRLKPQEPTVHRELARLLLSTGRCDAGRQHARIYAATASFIEDFDYVSEAADRCS